MGIFNAFACLMVLTALFAYVNHRFIKLPNAIGIMILGLLFSLAIVGVGTAYPAVFDSASSLIKGLNFTEFLMEVALSFLLFAGAFHLDTRSLIRERGSILVFATFGIVLTTFLIGGMMFVVLNTFDMGIPFIYCLLFGSLISPTDPVAVLSILKDAKVPKEIETNIAGESLFNDGVAVVIFITIYKLASQGTDSMDALDVGILFAEEAIGGIILGIVLGYTGKHLLQSIDAYIIEVIITLALVVGGYALAIAIHVSGPLAVVVAGLLISVPTPGLMSESSAKYVDMFWEMLDEILNAVLFLFIGLEILAITYETSYFGAGLAAIVVVLVARFISVSIFLPFTSFGKVATKNKILILGWGGIRGGISVALALSLTPDMHRELILTITYVVVVFSIVVQGLTISPLVKKLNLVE